MPRAIFGSSLHAVVSLGVLLLIGCAGTVPEPDSGQGPPPAAGAVADTAAQAGPIHVTLYTATGQVDVEDFTIDMSNRKFLRQMFGFRPSDLKVMTSIPFAGIDEILILGSVPDDAFTVLFTGRERMGLRREEMFDTRVLYPDGSTVDFYAILPKMRGFREVQRWEQTLTNNPIGLTRIEFR
jgi:hypothetical protein